jgi:ubiquinone/menaquinone biosynthesis C-methylase UbiE
MGKTAAYDDKAEAVKQWDNDPCGLVSGQEVGSREFFEAVSLNRYENYAPWMPKVIGFDRYPGKRLVEVGFGLGTDLFEFAKNGSRVSGVDLTPRHLELASKRFELYGLAADLRLGDAEALPFEDESFDVAYSFGALHHTPNTQRALDEILRVLVPGGTAIVGVYHRWSAFMFWKLMRYVLKGHFRSMSVRRALSEIEVRRNSDACPLVKVYSRRELSKMMAAYREVRTEVHHLDPARGPWPTFATPGLVRRLESYIGWYVIAFATK